ncbi:MAG TPA: cobaltochelatase subunit CobT, partial [Dongiaceae bacterium]
MSRESRLDEFRRVTGATMRAIAHKVELNVNFAPGQPGFTGSEARLPLPARDLPPEDVAQTRGAADSIALRLRHHDSKLHARETPKNEAAREVFEAIELARVEAIGALQMKGVAAN